MNGIERGTAQADWRTVRHVLLAGLLGGILSWVYATVVGVAERPEGWLGLPGYALLGAGAAGIGVFLLANTDLSAPVRGLAFALACGFSWKPVYDAAGALVVQRVDQNTAEDVRERTEEALDVLGEARRQRGEEQAQSLERSADELVSAVERLGDVRDVRRRRELEERLQDALEEVSRLGVRHPEIGIDSIERIGTAAREVGAGELKEASASIIQRYGEIAVEGAQGAAAPTRELIEKHALESTARIRGGAAVRRPLQDVSAEDSVRFSEGATRILKLRGDTL